MPIIFFNLLAKPAIAYSQPVGDNSNVYEQQVAERDSQVIKFTKFLTESFLGIFVITVFVIFLAVALYLALGVIFLVFFGGIGGK